jgi:hypothetical protein
MLGFIKSRLSNLASSLAYWIKNQTGWTGWTGCKIKISFPGFYPLHPVHPVKKNNIDEIDTPYRGCASQPEQSLKPC